MTNPYNLRMSQAVPRSSFVGRPWLVCAFTSVVAIPIWVIGLIAVISATGKIDNPAGIPVYMIMSLALSILVVPINSFAIAPILAGPSKVSYTVATIVHLLVGAGVFGLLWVWPSMISKMPTLIWTIIPYYLSIFLLPPMLVGSFVYSLRSVALDRQKWTNNPMDRSGGSAST